MTPLLVMHYVPREAQRYGFLPSSNEKGEIYFTYDRKNGDSM
jgi:hypothetical protein